MRVLQALRHPNIIAYQDSFITGNATRANNDTNLCIILEWASGGDLSALISRRKQLSHRFTEPEVLKYCYQLCSALAHCHQTVRLLHRDLKPANIFVSADGTLKIGDFGISRFLSNSGALAQTQCGTPLYMSPEMAQGRAYTSAADVWALGCILYEMMSLSPPWLTQLGAKAKGLTVPSLMHTISRGVLDINPLLKTYSPPLCALIGALVSRDPAKRPPLAAVLEWPIMRSCAPPGLALPRVPSGQAAGLELHAAAQVLQRSFKRSFRRDRISAPMASPTRVIYHDITDTDIEATRIVDPGSVDVDEDALAIVHARQAAVAVAVAARPLFIACRIFSGAHRGYVFKMGGKGLGYYADVRPPPARAKSAQAPAEQPALRPAPRLLRIDDGVRKPSSPVDVTEAAPLTRVPSSAGLHRGMPKPPVEARAVPISIPRVPSNAAIGYPHRGRPVLFTPIPMDVQPMTPVDYAGLGRDARKRGCAAAVAAAHAAKRAVDSAAVARVTAAGAGDRAMPSPTTNAWGGADNQEVVPTKEVPTRRESAAKPVPARRSGDPLSARRALQAALEGGRPSEVAAAAEAAQKIIDSFKASQAKRRNVAAADAEHKPSQRPPARALRVTPNRRLAPARQPQMRPVAPSPYAIPQVNPRMGKPLSAQ